ncbi:hypothetical protein F0562_014374 [Nyssa sinensis]|uniref:F-box protein n=1 Tax=Nyssa sinensis TaxID=561372 RepID=A0A5J4ZQY5_9ASTE|nr:hypothetical protein F0562_014374 [Nyssa sinensis]
MAKLYAIMEAVADRVEMHKNIGEQRNNWNSLLLTSVNAITLAAATIAGIAATTASMGAPLVALKLSSTLMYLAATGMMLIMNKIQPSQLAEEQRNAARLFKQLHGQIQTTVKIGTPIMADVKEFMDKVLALDKAYPLPLLGAMLEKFPSTVEPAVWWPQQPKRQGKVLNGRINRNGWNGKLEEEMREIVGVLKRKDKADYLRLGEKALKINKVLAISGPLLTGLAAVGSAFVGSPSHGSWAVMLGCVAGALASVVNTFEHGGQVGMVFEMYRSNAGFFSLMEESIESNLKERDIERRDNGELFEMKVALQLGRSLSQLKDLTASSSRNGEAMEEATINMPKLRTTTVSLPKLPTRVVEEFDFRSGYIATQIDKHSNSPININFSTRNDTNVADPIVMAKLYAIMEAVADRVEMHKNIGEQRNNWNSLLLTSINTITLTAATMAGIAATTASIGAPVLALKFSSTLMYLAATGMMLIMNKIQPSQLAEEQRNAARLFKQLHGQIQTTIKFGTPTVANVKEFMDKVLALDKAYPLPLLGAMLDKFPSTVEPAVWWPQQPQRQEKGLSGRTNMNGWNGKLEEEMREIVGVLKRKDKADYLRLGGKALKINKLLAISGPLLTGLAAVGSAFVGSPSHGSWAAVLGCVAGALASVVNTFEHGGQVGMVFEMYRSNAGFFSLMEESIESNLTERDVERRENGELFEMKVALQLGRSLSQLKDLTASSSRKGEAVEEFASKLF